MRPLAVILLALCLAGCVEKGAVDVKAPVLSPEVTTALSAAVDAHLGQFEAQLTAKIDRRIEARMSGNQQGGPRSFQIGSVVIDGGTLVLVVLCCSVVSGLVLLAWLWKAGIFAGKATVRAAGRAVAARRLRRID